MKVTQSTFLKSVAAFTVAALTLTISSCSSGEDTSASSTDTENSSTQAAASPHLRLVNFPPTLLLKRK